MNKNMRDQEKQGSAYSAFDLAQIHFGSGINLLAGVWLLIAPGFLGYPRPISRWNDILLGVLLIILAILRYSHPFHRFWISWINATIGLWLIAAPFVFKVEVMAAHVNDISVGIIVFIAGAISGSVRSHGR